MGGNTPLSSMVIPPSKVNTLQELALVTSS